MTENSEKEKNRIDPVQKQETKEIRRIREQELFDAYELIKDTVVIIRILRKVPYLTEEKVEVKVEKKKKNKPKVLLDCPFCNEKVNQHGFGLHKYRCEKKNKKE